MTTRLDRLFILLETGANATTKRAAAQQLGEAQRLHPHELHHLLGRVSILLKSTQWDTRIAAAHAVQAIITQVPKWNPKPLNDGCIEDTKEEKQIENINKVEEFDARGEPYIQKITNRKLNFENFDISQILAQNSYLTGSEGNEYDVLTENESTFIQNEKILASNFGLHPHLIEVDSNNLYSLDDLSSMVSSDVVLQVKPEKILLTDNSQENTGLSRREINRARRKARQSTSKQYSRESDTSLDKKNSNQACLSPEMSTKKLKIDSTCEKRTWYDASSNTIIDSRCAVPDATGCWPDSAIEWPFEAFAENLFHDLFSKKWEVRHGAATALRELIRLHGQGAGKSRKQSSNKMEQNHKEWLIDAALRLLCILAIDRFGDFISDQVVAPVRETCAQALGSLVMLISNKKNSNFDTNAAKNKKNSDKVENINKSNQSDIMGLLSIILNLLKHKEWEARHGALLALKYLLVIRNDILPVAFPAIMQCLSDPVEDVGAMAASALIPVAFDLPKLIDSKQLDAIVFRLWHLLKEQDDLAAACNSFMGLLAAILSLPATRTSLSPQPLSVILPQLWPFLNHPSSSVRKATLQTLETLVEVDEGNDIIFKDRWGENAVLTLKEALQNTFQRVLIEHIPNIQDIAERVWKKLVTQSDLEFLLHAACPLIGTWLCLAMQPELIPFNPSLFVNVATQKIDISTKSTLSELKIYIGGIETIPQYIRHSNVIRARCMAARMLGLLSMYIVKPIPGISYTSEIVSPSLCYAKVLLAHLNSKSALQRTLAALTMSYWATINQADIPVIPEILKKQLFICLNEYIYYDEIAGSVSRLLHECRDYMATLRHYNYSFPSEINADVINLDQIAVLASTPISNLPIVSSEDSNSSSSSLLKLKSKLIENLEERRRTLEIGALTSASQQQTLHVTVMAALAGAATMLHCLPEAPSPLNPLVKPLMESIKKEEDDELQKLSAKHLAHLIDFCVDRIPCPNAKIVTNLSNFLCSDLEYTPRIIVSNIEYEPFNGILTLSNRQKQAEKLICSKNNTTGVSGNKGPGKTLATEIVSEETSGEELEAKAAKIRRQGAIFAFTAIVSLLGAQLPSKLPQLWKLMLPDMLQNYNLNYNKIMSIEEANQLVFNFQVLEVILPSLDDLLFSPVMECLKNMCFLLANHYKIVRHMASRCIAILASLKTKETMDFVVHRIIAYLEINQLKNEEKILVTNPNDINILRQGASEALACLVEILSVNIVPYAVLFMVPLLGRMSDQNESVRLTCSATFATLVQLLPLDPGCIDTSYLTKEKVQEQRFLEQLLNPHTIPDTELTVPIATKLRSYQQQGLNWLNFLHQYHLHGVLCDDMGLGKTLQTLCILALDHHRNQQAPASLIVCPPTLTGHWIYEADQFFNTSDLTIIQYAGSPLEREKMRSRLASYKLIVASYDIVRKDIEFFEKVQWNYCVLDEGHIIKNGKTKSAKAVKKLHAHHRLILSGTPVQNNVLELWSLFDFLMPGFLGSEKQFSIKYSKPILTCREPKAGAKEQEAGALAMEALHRQVLPFLLRRNKEDVLQDLPPKITQDYYCDLSDLQKYLYEDFKTRHSASLINNVNGLSNSNSGHIFEALRYLRNVCNHPKLVLNSKHPQYQTVMDLLNNRGSTLTDIEHGAKLLALKQLLLDCGIGQPQHVQYQQGYVRNSIHSPIDQTQAQLVSQHRALIFCQLKAMLDIVENDLLKIHLTNVTYLRLDGGIPPSQRHSIVTRFNADPSIDVLLLTTQVGGLGLNLTGADTVIFVEHDWNPMKDLQAMDRAHRIGQKKVVNVYRLITRRTVEEKIMGLQKFKLLTANTIISKENSSLQTMKTDQLLDLFQLDKEKRPQNDSTVENKNEAKVSDITGINQSVLEILPDLWEQQQYDDEYNLDLFLSTLKSSSG